MSYSDFIAEYFPRFLQGTLTTAALFLLAAILAVAIAVVMALMKLSKSWPLRMAANGYIELFRGTSLLVQMFWIFFVLPLFGLTLDKFFAGFLAVAMNLGAYGAELTRAGIQAVPKGQWEAAYALSMSPSARMRRIIFPQALLIMLPSWGNLLIELLKGSALVSLISVTDLMFQAKQINSTTFLSAQAFGSALVIYYVFARFIVTPAVRRLERSLRRRQSRA